MRLCFDRRPDSPEQHETTPEVPSYFRARSPSGESTVYLRHTAFTKGNSSDSHFSPDQLIVHDDPAFLPELALPGLDIDLSALDISTDDSSRRSSLLFPLSQHSSVTSTHETDESMHGLIIPSSGTGGGGSIGGFVLPGDDRSSAQRTSRMRSILGEDEGFDLDPGFTFDDQGDIIFNDAGVPVQVESATRPGPVRLGSDSATSARVRQEIEEGMQAGQFDVSGESFSHISKNLLTQCSLVTR